MEDVQRILNLSESDLENSSDNDSASEYLERASSVSKPKNESTGKKKETSIGGRLPTRRPDPSVFNRNALLARENRLKKKIHLESVEKELEAMRNANRELVKALKRQVKFVRRLEKEKQYFKNIIANRTEIRHLVSILNARVANVPSSSVETAACKNIGSFSPTSSTTDGRSSSSCSSSYDFLSNTCGNSENDFESTPAIEATWNELLHDEEFGLNPTSTEHNNSSPPTTSKIYHNFNEDHAYTATFDNATKSNESSTGICLHIAGGKVSLEFCPTCHWNASDSLPTQLLDED